MRIKHYYVHDINHSQLRKMHDVNLISSKTFIFIHRYFISFILSQSFSSQYRNVSPLYPVFFLVQKEQKQKQRGTNKMLYCIYLGFSNNTFHSNRKFHFFLILQFLINSHTDQTESYLAFLPSSNLLFFLNQDTLHTSLLKCFLEMHSE